MSVAVNSVLVYEGDETDGGRPRQRIAILWISGDGSGGFCIDLEDPKAQPVPFLRADLERDLDDLACVFGPPNMLIDVREPTPSEAEVRDLRWAALRDEVADEPAVYDPEERTGMYRRAAERGRFTLNTARSLFQTYWRRGKTPAALTPGFHARGGAGVLREASGTKTGRPRAPGVLETGLNLNREQKRSVLAIARAQFRKLNRRSLASCYRLWLNRFFMEDGIGPDGKPARVLRSELAATGAPTLAQFKRVYYSLADVIEARKLRNPRKFALEYRPLTSTATAETWGPGSRFAIDATMADIYLVSRDNRERIVGRPVIYVVIDVWSRLIVGLYVAIEDASWTSAMMALANAACSKVGYCAEHGIEIAEEDWPAANIGARLLSDRGEVDSKVATNLALHFNVTLEVAQAYRGDLKGTVETQFNTVQVQFGEHVPGYVEKDFNTRGARDYRLDAVLDIQEFTSIVIDIVLNRNSKTLARYDKDQGMPADVVQLAPIELWHWGLANRSGRFRQWPEEYVRFRLMPTAVVSVDRNGISFQGRSYVGPTLLRLMSKARTGARERVTISYDPRVTDVVYLHDPDAPNGYVVCTLHERSRAYADRTTAEADQEHRLVEIARRNAATRETVKAVNLDERIEGKVKKAKARKGRGAETSKAQRLHGIKQNRREEKQRTKDEHGERFRPEPRVVPGPEAPSAQVIRLNPPVEDYSETGLDDFKED